MKKSSKTNPKKKHHYIPVFYLNGFGDSRRGNLLYVYDKTGGKPFESTPNGVAFENHYFSFINWKGDRDSESVENWFAEIEGKTSGVIRKIISCNKLTKEEKVLFSVFVAMMMVRAPNYRRNIEYMYAGVAKETLKFLAANKEKFTSWIKRFISETGTKIKDIEQFRQDTLNFDKLLTAKAEPLASLQIILPQIQKLTRIFCNMKWEFLRATEDYKFITGDNPLCYMDPTHNSRSLYGVGLANKHVEITLPLSRDMAVFGAWEGEDGIYLPGVNKLVKQINERTVISTDRFVFTGEKTEVLKRFLQKYRDSVPKVGE
ncbi:MAG: DUF4238 domain-containing protein [Candidatus Omnitrophica bacterium]|nr:DUF4238 domain-containing protein [Candidatus Omnitrophota bacterium]